MRRVLLIDSIATRYHLLPSEVVARADTLDMLVMDVSIGYQRKLEKENERKQAIKNGQLPPAEDLPLNTLQEMVNRVKKK